jgi:hypothetical protein
MNERGHAAGKSWPELVGSVPEQPAKDSARALHGIIRAAQTANLQIDEDMPPKAAGLIRNAVDGLLEAAEIMAHGLARDLDMNAPEVGQ